MCHELADLGMDMARNACRAGAHEWTAPATATEPTRSEHQPQRQKTPPDPAPRAESASPSLAFARITRAIHQIIALEVRVAADLAAKRDREETRAATARHRAAQAAREAQANTAAPPQRATPPSAAPQPARTARAYDEIPSLLANLSREMGVDLENPSHANRLPTFLRTTDPP